MAVKILLDPGHFYGVNKVTSGYAEGTRMWVLYTMLRPMLEEYGFKVGTTRTSTYNYPKTSSGADNIEGRGRMAKGYDLMLSLHTNAAGSTAVNRPVIIYPVSGKMKDLADDLGAALQACMNLQKYQLMQRWNSAGNADYYGVIRGAASVSVPCLILEHTFHTNFAMAKWLMDDANLKKVAQCVADTVAAYYGYKKTATETKTETKGTLYRIRKTWANAKSQIGAYKSLAGAKKACKVGYTVYDENGNAVYTAGSAPVKASFDPAQKFYAGYSKQYTVKTKGSDLRMRRGAGTSKDIIKKLANGSKVRCYGYYTQQSDGTIWLLVVDKTGAVGYCSKTYLK